MTKDVGEAQFQILCLIGKERMREPETPTTYVLLTVLRTTYWRRGGQSIKYRAWYEYLEQIFFLVPTESHFLDASKQAHTPMRSKRPATSLRDRQRFFVSVAMAISRKQTVRA